MAESRRSANLGCWGLGFFLLLGSVHFSSGFAPQDSFRFTLGAVLPVGAETESLRRGYELLREVRKETGWEIKWLDDTVSHFHLDVGFTAGGGDEVSHLRRVTRVLNKGTYEFHLGSIPPYSRLEAEMAGVHKVISLQCCSEPPGDVSGFFRHVYWLRWTVQDLVEPVMQNAALRGILKWGLIYDNQDNESVKACGTRLLRWYEDLQLHEEGVGPLVREEYNMSVGEEVFGRFAQKCMEEEVEAVVACCRKEACGKVLGAIHDTNYPLKVTYLMEGPTDADWLANFPLTEIRDVFTSVPWHVKAKIKAPGYGSLWRFRSKFKSFFNTTENPTHDTANAFSAGLVLVAAIQGAMASCNYTTNQDDPFNSSWLLHNSSALSCTDGEDLTGYRRIQDALRNLDIVTMGGPVKFDSRGRNIKRETITTQVRKPWRNLNSDNPFTVEVVLPIKYATINIKIPASNPYKETCEEGYYVGPDEFDPCIMCPPGEVSRKKNADHCDSCTLFEWLDKPGQQECNQCPLGTVVENRGATNKTDCMCKENFFHPLGLPGMACLPCSVGAECPGGLSPPIPKKDHWSSQAARSSIYSCRQKGTCLGGRDVERVCARGYTGRLCAECQSGYFQFVDKCWKCSSNLSIVLYILLIILVWYVLNVVISRNVSSLDMLLGFAQLANVIGDVELNWPGMLSSVFGSTNLLDFDVDILEPTCLFPAWSFSHNLFVQLLLPLLMGGMAHFGYLASWIVFKLTQEKRPIIRDGALKYIEWVVSVPQTKEDLASKWDETLAAYLAAIDVTYVTVAKYCCDSFKCETIGEARVMTASPDLECGTPTHKIILTFAAIGILVYPVGFASFISWKLFEMWTGKSFSNPQNLRRYGFLYRRFEPDYFWMSIVVMFRRMGFVCALVFIDSPAFQAGGLAIITNASLMLHVYTAPYIDTHLDVLFSFLLVSLMFETFGGLIFFNENLPEKERVILEWLVLATILILVIVFLVIFAREVVRLYKVHVLKKLHVKLVLSELTMHSDDCEEAGLSLHGRTVSSRAAKEQISHELLETFDPEFLYRALVDSPANMRDWDRLTNMLKDYMCDQSETSFLSMENVAMFWRKLVERFPELVDYLALVDDDNRVHFREYINTLYFDFFLKKRVEDCYIFNVLNWRDRAAMAQWLSHCDEEDRRFFTTFMGNMIRHADGEEKYGKFISKLDSTTGNVQVETPGEERLTGRSPPCGVGRIGWCLSVVPLLRSAISPNSFGAIRDEIEGGLGPMFHSASKKAMSMRSSRSVDPTQTLPDTPEESENSQNNTPSEVVETPPSGPKESK